MSQIVEIVEAIRQEFIQTNELRDETLRLSRALVRACANAIRAIHRHEWAEVETLLQEARADAKRMVEPLAHHPSLYHAGYTQDALKEVVEAHVVHALVRGEPLPQPHELYVTGSTYLRGLSEAATEMRRFVLDLMRQGKVLEAEPYLLHMDEIYSQLITVDFPDAITDGLRRHTDILRGVLERTRGDLTLAIRQDQMRQALYSFETRLGNSLGIELPAVAPMAGLEPNDEASEL
ncbi:MAG: haloacid dehalogenase [Caldilineaceae bacterium]|nr:haloacid dehalogenase [Caldilineaceae bacterium]